MSEKIKLTEYSKGAGCGCKIAPAELERILKGNKSMAHPKLLVGNETGDDAAVYEVGKGKAVISTTDFFMPIVNDAFDFGRIAAANALSDVYAMGGSPLMAIAILGWPVEKLPAELAGEVLRGGQEVCREAGIPLAGGHSIDSSEPIFGLSVTGEVSTSNIRLNSRAKEGDLIYLTKALGLGILTTAHKRGLAEEDDFEAALKAMTYLNQVGTEMGKLDFVHAMTDVTGFGLLGHLLEIARGSDLTAEIHYESIPLLPNVSEYVKKMIYPDITFKNWKSYEMHVTGIGPESLLTLCDPQTSGGLLMAVDPDFEEEFTHIMKEHSLDLKAIGKFFKREEKFINIS